MPDPGRRARSTSPRGARAIDRALLLLELLGEDAAGYRLADLAVRSGLPASTLHRLLTTLEARAFVQFDRPARTWHVGPRLFAIGSSFFRQPNLAAAAMPALRALRNQSGETANLAMPDGGEMIVVAQVESFAVVRAVALVGGRVPMINDALGKAVLSTYDEAEVAELIRTQGMTPVTRTSITRPGVLREELNRARRDGYAVDRGEYLDDLRCVAAPVCDKQGRAVAALSISGLKSRVPEERLPELGHAVRAAAGTLTALLGGKAF